MTTRNILSAKISPRYRIGGMVLLVGAALCGCQTNAADSSNPPPAPPPAKVDVKSLPPEAQKAASAAYAQGDAIAKHNAEMGAKMQADLQKAEAAKHK